MCRTHVNSYGMSHSQVFSFKKNHKPHNLKFSFGHPLVGVYGNFILSRIAPEIEGQ